jgi:hypothetical protein
MNTILEKALNLIANAQTLEKLQDVARWAETHAELTQEECDHVHEAIKSRIVELSIKSM